MVVKLAYTRQSHESSQEDSVALRNLFYGGCRQAVKTSDCDSDIRGFDSHQPPQTNAPMAQLEDALSSKERC